MESTICHFEIPVTDLDQGRRFYTEMFGWTVAPAGEQPYLLVRTSDQPGALGGGLLLRSEQQSVGTTLYVLVESIDAAIERAQALGAQVLSGRAAIPRMGWVALVSDPQGNPLGLFQADGEAS